MGNFDMSFYVKKHERKSDHGGLPHDGGLPWVILK
jgi:hypothetical protein